MTHLMSVPKGFGRRTVVMLAVALAGLFSVAVAAGPGSLAPQA